MRFEWDDKKNAANIKKHGVSFPQAMRAFGDPVRREYYDHKHSDLKEERMIALGTAGLDVLFIRSGV